MLECALNISEGTRTEIIAELQRAGGDALLDTHSDTTHNRSVLTLAGTTVLDGAKAVARVAVERIDLRHHSGVHPFLGVVDVVPFTPINSLAPIAEVDLSEAIDARTAFADFMADELEVPCFFYGPRRSLPDVRRGAFTSIAPDRGPNVAHESAGACCVGARPVLVAYNLWLDGVDLRRARSMVKSIRTPQLRCLAFVIGTEVQISCNLVAPWHTTPADAFDAVAALAPITRAELVGLVPESVLYSIPATRWPTLDLSPDRTIEYRLRKAGAKNP